MKSHEKPLCNFFSLKRFLDQKSPAVKSRRNNLSAIKIVEKQTDSRNKTINFQSPLQKKPLKGEPQTPKS